MLWGKKKKKNAKKPLAIKIFERICKGALHSKGLFRRVIRQKNQGKITLVTGILAMLK